MARRLRGGRGRTAVANDGRPVPQPSAFGKAANSSPRFGETPMNRVSFRTLSLTVLAASALVLCMDVSTANAGRRHHRRCQSSCHSNYVYSNGCNSAYNSASTCGSYGQSYSSCGQSYGSCGQASGNCASGACNSAVPSQGMQPSNPSSNSGSRNDANPTPPKPPAPPAN